MTIEEKAKAYDESIERAKVFKEHLLEIDEKDYADEMDYVFPELKESEDERTRKSIIELLNEVHFTFKYYNINKMLAWLEKQGEQIDIANKEYWRGYREGKQEVLDKYTELEKQGEQKPNPCENCGIATNNCQKFPCTIRDSEQKPANWFQELEDTLANATPQQLAEWKERYFKEEPAEWSEEDEKIFNFIGAMLSEAYEVTNRTNVLPFLQVRDWLLLHLRPQNRWKPSDEQLRVLDLAIRCGINRGTTEETTLVSLFNDLKKLTE